MIRVLKMNIYLSRLASECVRACQSNNNRQFINSLSFKSFDFKSEHVPQFLISFVFVASISSSHFIFQSNADREREFIWYTQKKIPQFTFAKLMDSIKFNLDSKNRHEIGFTHSQTLSIRREWNEKNIHTHTDNFSLLLMLKRACIMYLQIG